MVSNTGLERTRSCKLLVLKVTTGRVHALTCYSPHFPQGVPTGERWDGSGRCLHTYDTMRTADMQPQDITSPIFMSVQMVPFCLLCRLMYVV